MFDTTTMERRNVTKPPPLTNFFWWSGCESLRKRFLTTHDAKNCEFTLHCALVLDAHIVEVHRFPLTQTYIGRCRLKLDHFFTNLIRRRQTNFMTSHNANNCWMKRKDYCETVWWMEINRERFNNAEDCKFRCIMSLRSKSHAHGSLFYLWFVGFRGIGYWKCMD